MSDPGRARDHPLPERESVLLRAGKDAVRQAGIPTRAGPHTLRHSFATHRCAERFAPLYPDTETALGVWRALREDNLRLCASVSPDDRERIGQVPWDDKGVSFRRYVASRGRHDLNHIEQIRAALTG